MIHPQRKFSVYRDDQRFSTTNASKVKLMKIGFCPLDQNENQIGKAL